MILNDVLYLKDSPSTREILTKEFGELKDIDINLMKDYVYIKFYPYKNKWIPTFPFEWLYKDKPKLTQIEDIISYSENQKKYSKWYRRIFLDKLTITKEIYRVEYKSFYDSYVFYDLKIKKWWLMFFEVFTRKSLYSNKTFIVKDNLKNWIKLNYPNKKVIITLNKNK